MKNNDNVRLRNSFWILLWCFSCILFCFLQSNLSVAQPLFILNSNTKIWTANSRLLLANCSNGLGVSPKDTARLVYLKPKTPWSLGSKIQSLVLVEHPTTKYPIQAFKNFLEFQHKYKDRKAIVYGVASRGTEEKGILYQFSRDSGEEIGSMLLDISFDTANLRCEEVYFNNDWHTLLILVANHKTKSECFLRVYEITENEVFGSRTINPLLTERVWAGTGTGPYNSLTWAGTGTGLNNSPKAMAIGNAIGKEWVLGFAGSVGGIGSINLVSLNSSNSLHQTLGLKTGEKSKLLYWLPVDTQSNGQVDKIYGVDELGNLWAWSYSEAGFSRNVKKLINNKINMNNPRLWVVPDINRAGIEIFFFGNRDTADKVGKSLNSLRNRTGEAQGDRTKVQLMSVKDFYSFKDAYKGSYIESKEVEDPKIQELMIGEFQDLFVRWGRLVLVTNNVGQEPSVVSRGRFGIRPLFCHWETLKDMPTSNEFNPSIPHPIVQSIVQSALLCDPKLQQEILITLDASCQTNLMQSNISQDGNGRSSWARVNIFSN